MYTPGRRMRVQRARVVPDFAVQRIAITGGGIPFWPLNISGRRQQMSVTAELFEMGKTGRVQYSMISPFSGWFCENFEIGPVG